MVMPAKNLEDLCKESARNISAWSAGHPIGRTVSFPEGTAANIPKAVTDKATAGEILQGT